jgi:glycolate oxidase FAD binding subunit
MKSSHDQLAQRLTAELGGDAIITNPRALAAYSVDGQESPLLCLPETPEQVAAVLRHCGEAAAAVVPWGGGTAMRIGNPPTKLDVIVGLRRLNRLVEHDPANLTVAAQSGMTFAALQQEISAAKQFLAFDPPFPDAATIGGTIAANINGVRRAFYGGVRDLVIGMKVVLPSGEQIKAGGKVVKNVAGYDMCKLFVGSLGSLGIITEVTVRVSPIPEGAATLVGAGTLPQVLRLGSELRCSPLLPAAIVVMNSEADYAPEPWNLAVWCEGFVESVERHLRDAQSKATSLGLKPQVLRNKPHRQFWSEVSDVPLDNQRTTFRVIVPAAALAPVLKIVETSPAGEGYARVVGDACTGTVWVSVASNGTSATWFSKLLWAAQQHHGHAVMFAAPAAAKENIDVWGPPPATLSLMREIKHQFDPTGMLNPGRFVTGI